jgi:hypothetical protein
MDLARRRVSRRDVKLLQVPGGKREAALHNDAAPAPAVFAAIVNNNKIVVDGTAL